MPSRKRLFGCSATALAFSVIAALAPATQASAAQTTTTTTTTTTPGSTTAKSITTKGTTAKGTTTKSTTTKGTTTKSTTTKSTTTKSTTTKSTTTKGTTTKSTTTKGTTTKGTTAGTTTGQPATGPTVRAPVPTGPAPVAQAALEGDDSYYVTSSNPQPLFDMGCQDGTTDAKNAAAQRLTILDFGGQYANGSGTEPVLGPAELTNAQLEQLAENYALGWYLCIGGDESSVLTLGVGTNNSLLDVTSSGGAAWANVVAAVADAEAAITDRIVVDGADDIETEFSTPAAALSWAAGYGAGGTGSYYLDYGDAGGCPETTADDGECNNGWDQDDVWAVSWGEPAALPMPEIYYAANAAQWAQISRYGKTNRNGAAINFSGDLSEYAAAPTTLDPAQSWSNLTTYLNTAAQTAGSSQWLSDIQYETP